MKNKEPKWMDYTICNHGHHRVRECETCIEQHKQEEIDHQLEMERIGRIRATMRETGLSARDLAGQGRIFKRE